MTLDQVWKLLQNKTKFIDITNSQKTFPLTPYNAELNVIPTSLKFQSVVKPRLKKISEIQIGSMIYILSRFHTRYYNQESWASSQKEIVDSATSRLKNIGAKTSVLQVGSGSFQKNVIARIEGKDPILKSQVIIVGAHYDSINFDGPEFCAPGADDNASGTAAVMETLRLIQAMMIDKIFLKRTIEFHWYAAEEIGLIGSGEVAQSYKTDGINVVGMLNLDVLGYSYNYTPIIGIYTDKNDTNLALNDFMRLLAEEYLDFKLEEKTCGYACSDHASWARFGFPSSFLAEPVFNPYIHKSYDTSRYVLKSQIKEFVKLAIGYMIEFGEIVK